MTHDTDDQSAVSISQFAAIKLHREYSIQHDLVTQLQEDLLQLTSFVGYVVLRYV